MYKDIDKPEIIPGLKVWKNPKNKFLVTMLHYTADEEKDPDRKGKEWYDREKMGALKVVWNKEYEIDFTTKSGKLIFGPDFCDFDPKVHFIDSFELQEPYELLVSLDFGQRHPTAALIGVWTKDSELYIIDEYYKPAIPSVSSRDMFKKFEYLMGDLDGKSIRQKRDIATSIFSVRVADPSTIPKNRTKVKEGVEIPYSVIEDFYDNGWDFEPGNNDVTASITRIREYMQIDSFGKTHIYIFKDKCPNLCKEIIGWRYKEMTELQERTRSSSEEPVKKNDDAIDALRYMMMTRPTTPTTAPKPLTKIQKDIQQLIRPKIYSNNFDNDDGS